MSEIMEACIAAGGTITGEHGVGLDKLPYMDALFTPETLERDVRACASVFDPERRANPGKVVPVHSCREWHGAPAARDAAGVTHRRAAARRRSRSRRRVRDARARRHGRPLRIVGGGTWLDAGRPVARRPRSPLSSLRGITEYVPGDLTLTVRAGTPLGEIARAIARRTGSG